eukprot:TRINITY_DN3792_c2_g2_i1.p1 TRINITY_DN3792_c2_g2~~TRINITY_DN3792_c2_g2_i1.p1  ORF type:complete len:772 (+),score=118.00 TRINITY_DN3792_c2_g2_i1:768-3083(+)
MSNGDPVIKTGWLEMKNMLGWSPRWCEFRELGCQFVRSHERDDRTTRKLSDLKTAILRLESGHASKRYIEVAYARSPEAGVHTLRLRAKNAQEARDWQQVIQQSQQRHASNPSNTTKVFRVKKDANGRVGIQLKRAVVTAVTGSAAAAGLKVGMSITRVCDTLIRGKEHSAAVAAISSAPTNFEIEAFTPRQPQQQLSEPPTVTPSLPVQVWCLAKVFKDPGVVSQVSEWIPPLKKPSTLLVVLWGWGSTVESKHVTIPAGASFTAQDVHMLLNSDTTWQAARLAGCSTQTWDTKALYFSGPSSGPSAGKQRRMLPSELLTDTGLTSDMRGLALHVVSCEAEDQIRQFKHSAGDKKKNNVSGVISLTDHQKIVAEKDEEIAKLTKQITQLRELLNTIHVNTGTPPWDEEEPSVVTELRDRVNAAVTLDDLESVNLKNLNDDDASFFTPVQSPKGSAVDDSEDWGGIDNQVLCRLEAQSPTHSLTSVNVQWNGPPNGIQVGSTSFINMVSKGAIDTMPPMSASDGFAEGWNLRAPGYRKTGLKIPSLDSMYTLAGVDIYKSDQPLAHIAQHLRLPCADIDPDSDLAGLPQTILFNLHIPHCEAPSVWGQEVGGPTINAVLIFTLKKSTIEDLKTQEIPAASLLKDFYEKVPEGGASPSQQPFLGRFKFLVRAERGIPKVFSKYNGKPVLVTRSGRCFRGDHYLEVDCNLRRWAYTARVALYSMWGALSQYKLHVGCCIEGREDSEIPERILGCAQLSCVDINNAPDWPHQTD